MGKGHKGPFSSFKHQSKMDLITHPRKAVKASVKVVNKVDKAIPKSKKLGATLEKVGGAVALTGALLGQPELSVLGAGITAAGGYEEGLSAGEIIGRAAGSLAGGALAGSLASEAGLAGAAGFGIREGGGDLGGELGGMLGKMAQKEAEKEAGILKGDDKKKQFPAGQTLPPRQQPVKLEPGQVAPPPRQSGNDDMLPSGSPGDVAEPVETPIIIEPIDELKRGINDNEHQQNLDKQNMVKMPGDLQDGNQDTGVGSKLQTNEKDIEAVFNTLDGDITNLKDMNSILNLLVNNFADLQQMPPDEQDQLFADAIKTGSFNTLLDQLGESL